MQALAVLLGTAALAVALAGPADACAISIGTSGTMTLSPDGGTLGSEVSGGSQATMFALLPLLSGVTIDVDAPTLAQAPGGYNSGSQTLQVAYNAAVLGLINVKDQPYTSSSTSFATGVLGAVTLTITLDNRIINPAGFAAGTYQTQTVVTCRP